MGLSLVAPFYLPPSARLLTLPKIFLRDEVTWCRPFGPMARSDRGYLLAAMQCDEELFILSKTPMSLEKQGGCRRYAIER